MPFNRANSCVVAIGLLVLFAASAACGQELQGFQLFAPADLSTFGGDIQANEGYFFQFDGLFWSISAPRTTPIGAPGLTRLVYYGPQANTVPTPPPNSILPPVQSQDQRLESDTLDTGDIKSAFSPGTRFEFGNIEDRNGWFCSILRVQPLEQDFTYQSADVVFKDPPQGPLGQGLLTGPVPGPGGTTVQRPLPVTLYNITMSNTVDNWGVELMYLHRLRTSHCGGTFEFFAGARYMEFNDGFNFQAGDDPGGHTVPSFLANSFWFTSAENHLVGPEVGLRWSKKEGRWMFSTEARFMAALNMQTFHQDVNLGPNLNPGGNSGSALYTPATLEPASASNNANLNEFSPLVELRLEGRYQITSMISFHAGWTGFWMDNIARANGVIDYNIQNPVMGFDFSSGNNKQNVLVNGVTIGFDINR
jgi:hypothetical protein